jgi:hypothetical protein
MANGLMKFGKDWSYLLPANVFFLPDGAGGTFQKMVESVSRHLRS